MCLFVSVGKPKHDFKIVKLNDTRPELRWHKVKIEMCICVCVSDRVDVMETSLSVKIYIKKSQNTNSYMAVRHEYI